MCNSIILFFFFQCSKQKWWYVGDSVKQVKQNSGAPIKRSSIRLTFFFLIDVFCFFFFIMEIFVINFFASFFIEQLLRNNFAPGRFRLSHFSWGDCAFNEPTLPELALFKFSIKRQSQKRFKNRFRSITESFRSGMESFRFRVKSTLCWTDVKFNYEHMPLAA